MKKTHLTIPALAIAFAFAPFVSLQAASPLTPESKLQVGGLVQTAKAKMGKKGKMSKRAKRRSGGRHVRSKGPGMCGENMYWSKKARKCTDARDKA